MSGCEYPKFGSIPRFNREVVVTEKIDGTNGLVSVEAWNKAPSWSVPGDNAVSVHNGPDDVSHYVVKAGSRNRWLTPYSDNFGFAAWVRDNATELIKLGPGLHYGEWYGHGIQRGYGLSKGERRFMLFNTSRWSDPELRPKCCEVSTVLWQGAMRDFFYADVIGDLRMYGSRHVSGYGKPEGVVIYHTAANALFKMTVEKDEGKSAA